MDAFYASVEQLDDPSLRGRPLLIGGTKGRGVVLTASYEARPFGVGSAMPMARAMRMCPKALVVPPRFHRYMEVSQQVFSVFDDFAPKVEALSLDEAFLDMTGAERIFGGPRRIARRIKDAVFEATGGLHLSVGVSGTKYVAKVASDHEKPDGLVLVPQDEAKCFLAPLPVKRLWGAGPVTAARIEALGLRTIGEVAAADPALLEQHLGVAGPHFHRLANARDPREVVGGRGAKSMGCERTLSEDVSERSEIELHLRRSADTIGRRLRKHDLYARGVRVKLKTSSFKLMSRQKQLPASTNLARRLYQEALTLLDEFDYREPFRLVGLAAFDLTKNRPVQLDLFDGSARLQRLEVAIDAVTNRFGDGALQRAEELDNGGGPRMGVNLDFLDE